MTKEKAIEKIFEIYMKFNNNSNGALIDSELDLLKDEIQGKIKEKACLYRENVWDNHGKQKECNIGFLDAMINKSSIKSTAGLGYNTNVKTSVSEKLENEWKWFATMRGNNHLSAYKSIENVLKIFKKIN